MNDIAAAARLLLVVNTCITVLLVNFFESTSAFALVLIAAWLTAPHVILLGVLFGIRRLINRRIIAVHVLAALVSTGGLFILAYLTGRPTDAQNALLIFYTPVFQAAGWLLCLPFVACIPKN